VADLGRKLFDRVATWTGHLVKLREAIFSTVERFNDAQGSLERFVLPSARKMRELGVGGEKEIPKVEPVDKLLRAVEPPKAE
jgi:DNA recombination protein RmuC